MRLVKNNSPVSTDLLELVPLDRGAAVELATGKVPSQLWNATNLEAVSPLLVDIGRAYVDLYGNGDVEPPWMGYVARDRRSGSIVGTCGFKDRSRDGMCEIAYFTFPTCEGRGFGQRMARCLVEIAFDAGARLIRAHTLPQENASTRILRKLDFVNLRDVHDPVDGIVWRWQLERAPHR